LTRNHLVASIIAAMDEVFKALADPSRRKLLDLLHENSGLTLTNLCAHLDMSRQAVTKHVNILENANLIATAWHGRKKLHYLNPVPIYEIYERWIRKYERHRLQALSDLKKHLERPDPELHEKSAAHQREPHPDETTEHPH
jgi:DNA-binding transcriptional ArsR family regulator